MFSPDLEKQLWCLALSWEERACNELRHVVLISGLVLSPLGKAEDTVASVVKFRDIKVHCSLGEYDH